MNAPRRIPAYDDRTRALIVEDAGDLAGSAAPERRWLVPEVLVRKGVTLLGGDGGAGKSLLALQLQVAAALGRPWLGLATPPQGLVTFGFYCEDDEDELHRRLEAICRHYACTPADLAGRVLYASRVGEPNELMVFGTRNDIGARTQTFHQLEEIVRARRVELAIIDTVADTFLGNENIRPQVRAFVNAVRSLALINDGGVVMTAHPSRAGLSDGSGLSGSTGWNASVRARIYLARPGHAEEGEGDADARAAWPTNERVLKTMKSNYGPTGAELRLMWADGVFVRTDQGGARLSLYDRLDDDRRLHDAAHYLFKNGAPLASDPAAKNSLVNRARALPSCKQLSFRQACAAQDRLVETGRLVRVTLGPKSKRRIYVRPAHLRYPGEDRGETATRIPQSATHDVQANGGAP